MREKLKIMYLTQHVRESLPFEDGCDFKEPVLFDAAARGVPGMCVGATGEPSLKRSFFEQSTEVP